MRARLRSAGFQVAAVGVGLGISALLLAGFGYDPGTVLSRLLDGAFGSEFALTQTALKATPLALTGLAVALCLRMRLWNIGAEGQLYAGAIGAAGVALFVRWPAPLLIVAMIAAGALFGALWALLAAVPRALWGANEIITTLLLNYVGILLVAYLVTGPWRGETNFPVSDPFPPESRLPLLGSSLLHVGVLFPLGAAAALAFLLRRSRWGFEVRMIGASPGTARTVGMSTTRNIVVVMAAGGALAGLAGMIEVSMTFGRLRTELSPGYGYMAIVIAALAGASMIGTIAVAVLFGGFVVGGFALQTLGIPQAFVLLLQGTILFCALAGAYAGGRRLPYRRRLDRLPGAPKEEPSTP